MHFTAIPVQVINQFATVYCKFALKYLIDVGLHRGVSLVNWTTGVGAHTNRACVQHVY